MSFNLGAPFNRANVLAMIEGRMKQLEDTYGWSEGDGRVVLGDNPERDKVLDWGVYECLRDMHEELRP